MTTPKPAPKKGAIIELEQEDFQGEVVIHKNLSQDVVLTTEDKLRLALIQHRETLNSRAEWVGAGTLALSFLSTLLLTTFKDIGPLSASTWQAVYFILFVLAFLRFVNILVRMYQNRKKATIDYVIRRIKQSVSQDDDGE
ncbi:MAG: hypothetical protein ABSD79_01060 [Dehalococcoidales bacterium]